MPLVAQVPKNEAFIARNGAYRRFLNMGSRKETAVQRQVARGGLGSYEPAFQAAILSLCEQPSRRLVFYDIGAHIGVYSMLVATIMRHRCPAVYAFEPTPSTADLCRALRDLNDLGYQVTQKALGAETGSVDFFLSPKAETSNSMNAGFRPGAQQIVVPVTTIDRVAMAAPPPTLIKIDVETLEPTVISGGRKTIASVRPTITSEFLPRKESRDEIGELLSWLSYYGYKFYQVTDKSRFDSYPTIDALDALDPEYRDWILSPVALGEDYFATLASWRIAMTTANRETNRLYDPGTFDAQELLTMW